MNVFKNIKVLSSFGNIVKALSMLITAIRLISVLFLAIQVVMLFTQMKKNDELPLNEIIKIT